LVNQGQKAKGMTARWIMRLAPYEFEVHHRPGPKNANADALSRLPVGANLADVLITELADEIQGFNPQQLREEQLNDPECGPLFDELEGREVNLTTDEARRLLQKKGHYEIVNNTLAYTKGPNPRYFIPRTYRLLFMTHMHNPPLAGHRGRKATLARLQQRTIWPNQEQDVARFVASCPQCQKSKNPIRPPIGLMQPIPVTKKFQEFVMDLLGPLPKTRKQNEHILVIAEPMTKWMTAVPLKKATGAKIGEAVKREIIDRYGCPRRIRTDRGSNIMKWASDACKKYLGVQHIVSTAYHPESQGLVERFNRTLQEMLRMYVADDQKDWDEYLPQVVMAYNTAKQESSKYTPFELMYGQLPRLPIETLLPDEDIPTEYVEEDAKKQYEQMYALQSIAKKNIDRAQERQKRLYDRYRRELVFEVGDLVSMKQHHKSKDGKTKKLMMQWEGPYVVIEQTSPVNYRIQDPDNEEWEKVVHVQALKKWESRVRELRMEGQPPEQEYHTIRVSTDSQSP
jgi:hypothetical protein